MSPLQAATIAINTIAKKYPTFVGAIVAANKHGEYGKILFFDNLCVSANYLFS